MGQGTAVKLEFALTDDLKSATILVNTENSKLLKAISDIDSAYKVMRSVASSAEKSRNALNKVTNLAEEKAKELGVSPSSVTGYSDAVKSVGIVDSTLDKANDI